MRSSLALIATAGVVAIALTGCASATSPAATPGDSSAAVSVRGEFGDEPRVSFPTPLTPSETQCTEVIEGEGDYLGEGQVAQVSLSFFSGASGELAVQQGYGEGDPTFLHYGAGSLPALNTALGCAREGSRVAVVAPAEDAYGEQGNAGAGIGPGDSIVLVVDVERAFAASANGAPQLTRDGFPAVVLAPDGRPGITVPKADAPESVETEVLKRGDGETVESGDQVLVQYTSVNWESGEVADSTWEAGTPAIFMVTDGEGAQAPAGVAEPIIGQRVGSQLGVIVPGEDGATLFYVIDILGVL